ITVDRRTHTLREHLTQTAQRAALFASAFGFGQWGWLCGLWHDLGKYSEAFQKKLRAAAGDDAHLEARAQVDHSTAGALYAVERFGTRGRLLAYTAAGHHAGLTDWEADFTGQA